MTVHLTDEDDKWIKDVKEFHQKPKINKFLGVMKGFFEEQKHPRNPKGQGGGGRFAPKGAPPAGTVPKGTTHVGITSYRANENTPIETVNANMKEFDGALRNIEGVRNVHVNAGWGGWEGGGEPSWKVSYQGNGEAMKLLAATGKKYNQDAVIVMKPPNYPGGQNTETADFKFDHLISDDKKKSIEASMSKKKIGGWTWHTNGGVTALRLANVPQWGGDINQHRANVRALHQEFTSDGNKVALSNSRHSVLVMENNDGENGYDRYIKK